MGYQQAKGLAHIGGEDTGGMKRFVASVFVSIGMGLLLLPLAQAMQGNRPKAAGAGRLDKTTWWVELRPKGKTPAPDVIVFEKGRFDSIACRAYGFGDATYQARAEGKAVTFRATTKSKSGETMEWKGKVEGKAISGTMVWKDAKGSSQEAAFSGKQQTATGMLDGTRWSVELKTEGEKPMPDTLVFEQGMFDSIACHQYGFGKGPYDAKKKGMAATFTAFTTSAREGMMEWSGEVTGDKISGAMTWHPTKGKAKKFTFTGTKEKRKGGRAGG
jgi:hypothetical protein